MILDCFEVVEEHVDHTVIQQKLNDVMTSYGLVAEQVKRIVTDGGSNVKLAVANSRLDGAWCLCHLIDLAVTHTLDGAGDLMKTTMERVKDIVSFYHKSTVATKNLRSVQRQDNEMNEFIDQVYKLQEMVKTRWNSLHDMIKRMLLLYDNVNASLQQLNKRTLMLQDDEIDILTAIASILLPISQLTKILEADKTPTAHLALPYTIEAIESIRDWRAAREDGYHRFPLTDAVARAVDDFRRKLLQELQERLSTVTNDEFFKISAFLSPKFKRMVFFQQQELAALKRSVLRMLRGTVDTNEQQYLQQQIQTSRPRNSLIGRYGESSEIIGGTGNDMLVAELERYCNAIVDRQQLDNPIQFWMDHRDAFPHLFPIAMEHLHVPMSSATAERVFSAMGRTITDLRNRLKPETASMLVFLKDHRGNW